MARIGIDARFAPGHWAVLKHEVNVADRCKVVELAVDQQQWLRDVVEDTEFRQRPLGELKILC